MENKLRRFITSPAVSAPGENSACCWSHSTVLSMTSTDPQLWQMTWSPGVNRERSSQASSLAKHSSTRSWNLTTALKNPLVKDPGVESKVHSLFDVWTSPTLLRSGCVLPLLRAGLSAFRTGVLGSTTELATLHGWHPCPQRCQSSQALLWIVPSLLAGDGEITSDRGYDPARSRPHEWFLSQFSVCYQPNWIFGYNERTTISPLYSLSLIAPWGRKRSL